MVQSLQLQSQQSRGDFHHFGHLKDPAKFIFSPSKDHYLHSITNTTSDVFPNLLTLSHHNLWCNTVTYLHINNTVLQTT